jgi:hypothetical protein
LIEVAIALAIFVFGALAIVQIFPPALGVIRNNESRITATQLGNTLLARTAGKPNSVPDAIYEGTLSTWDDLSIAVVGTSSKNRSLPAGVLPTEFDSSALGHFKLVDGERHLVQAAGGTQYALLNFPCTAGTVNIYEEDTIEGVQIDDDGNLDFSNARRVSNGAPFYATPQTTRPPDAFRSDDFTTYYVSYRWRYDPSDSVRNPDVVRVMGVLEEPLLIPDDGATGWTSGQAGKVAQGLVASSNHIVPGAVAVRFVHRVGYATVPVDDAARGYINFNGGYTVENDGTTPLSVTTGKKYLFSYTVSDWRSLSDNSAPTSAGLVSLPLKNLDNSFPVNGLLTTVGTTSAPVVAAPVSVDYKQGQVAYNVSGLTAPRVRTTYRTLDNWANQLSVAARTYVPFYSGSDFTQTGGTRSGFLPREPWREYAWVVTDSSHLYFHASEAGKSVVVSYEYDDGGTFRVNNNAILTIKNDIIPAPAGISTGVGGFAENGQVSSAEIVDPLGNTVNATAILSVQGLSVHARTAWLNADKYNQVIVPAYRNLLQ